MHASTDRDERRMEAADGSHPQGRAGRFAFRALVAVAAIVVLGAVFLLYTQPAFVVTLIDQVWSCF